MFHALQRYTVLTIPYNGCNPTAIIVKHWLITLTRSGIAVRVQLPSFANRVLWNSSFWQVCPHAGEALVTAT